MKTLIILLSIVMLLVGLPLLHGFFVLASFEELANVPSAKSFFYLFTIPAWTLVIIVFVVETYRRSFIRSRYRIGNTLMLGLSGLIAPTVGLALSPVAGDIGLPAFAGIAVIGFFVGLLGALLFNFVVGWIKKMDGV
jgi:hypothetical protein